jgi:hypothetical protein
MSGGSSKGRPAVQSSQTGAAWLPWARRGVGLSWGVVRRLGFELNFLRNPARGSSIYRAFGQWTRLRAGLSPIQLIRSGT